VVFRVFFFFFFLQAKTMFDGNLAVRLAKGYQKNHTGTGASSGR